MRNLTLLCILVLFSVLFMGCQNNKTSVIKETIEPVETFIVPKKIIDFSSVTTVGNHSYIPLNIKGNTPDNALLILNILEEFENQHLELEITDWKIEKQQLAFGTEQITFGLWVDHKKKQP